MKTATAAEIGRMELRHGDRAIRLVDCGRLCREPVVASLNRLASRARAENRSYFLNHAFMPLHSSTGQESGLRAYGE